MKKRFVFPIICCCFFLLFLAIQVQAQTSAQQGQDQTSINSMVGGTQVIQMPESTSGGSATKIPRNFSNPMILPGTSGPIYYGGPVRFGKELLDVGFLIKFKDTWDPAFADRFANNRPGKVNVSSSIPVTKDSVSAGTAVTLKVHQPQDLRNFNRSYELLDVYNIDGTDGADSAKLLGKAAEKANAIGADIGIVVQQGANFELHGKDRQLVVGFSPSVVGGGAGSAAGGVLGVAAGWADHRAKYLTQPFLTVLLFKSTGVPYRWVPVAPEKPAVASADPNPEGVNDATPTTAAPKMRPTKKPDPSLLQK